MNPTHVIALDQGTTSSRAVLFNLQGEIEGLCQREFPQHLPRPGWVEHDPQEIWQTQRRVLDELVERHRVDPARIAAVGIANQRETTIVWDRNTGLPVHNAIVWQDRRTAPICENLKAEGLEAHIRHATGLVADAYFSGPKVRWILDHVAGARQRAERGDLLFGTVDTWLIWKLTDGRVHATDVSNASRTLLYDIRRRAWDETLLAALDVPAAMLPEVRPSSGDFGELDLAGRRVPIAGVAGDQQAALFGQACFTAGMAKNTYGTGCFLLMNTGTELVPSVSGLLSTIAWGIDGRIDYALEGSVFAAGAALQWLRDGLKIIESAPASEEMARLAGDADEVYVVPAFVGLGAPYWDMYARGAILGITRDTARCHIVKATLQSLAYQSRDVLEAMQADADLALRQLQVDGGACANDYLMQFQADILGRPVERPQTIESTALGAAGLAGRAVGLWTEKTFAALRRVNRRFEPAMETGRREALYAGWKKAVRRAMHWVDP